MENTTEFKTADKDLIRVDPIILIRDVMKKWLVILLIAVIFGIGAYVVKEQTYQPVYKTSTTFVLSTRESYVTIYSNLTSTSTLATVFTDLLNSSILQKLVLEETGLTSFDGTITASQIPDTNLLTLEVTAGDPRTAFLVTKALIDNHEIVTYQVMGSIVLEVLQNPVVPTWPSNASGASGAMKRAFLIAALAACLLFGAVSYYRDTVRSKKEAKEKLDCWYMGEIHHERKYKSLRDALLQKKSGILITNAGTSFGYTESIKKLRLRVEQYLKDDKVLVVSSLMENEGKTTVAVNLALALAKKRKKVLLIDCDLRKPACHKILGSKWNGPGLEAILAGKANLREAMTVEQTTGLHVIQARSRQRNPGELLASDRMGALITATRKMYDVIILDMPPMIAATDTEMMLEHADASLLVVRQNMALTSALNKAVITLKSGKARLLGCVLNDAYTSRIGASYGYGYGHGYGTYYGYGYGRYGNYGSYGHYGHDGSRKRRRKKK